VASVSTDEELLRSLTHCSMQWNTPLSLERADELISLLELRGAGHIVDLGCGWGSLLIRALGAADRWTGVGVDQNGAYLKRARTDAITHGVQARVEFINGDIRHFSGRPDRVICIGADHAWSNVPAALTHLRSLLAPEGRLLFGCGYWERAPRPEHIEMFGVLPISVEEIERQALGIGYRVVGAEAASLAEWDVFESEWLRDLEEIAGREGLTVLGRQAAKIAQQRRAEYVDGYRGVLGFAYLVLQRGGLLPDEPQEDLAQMKTECEGRELAPSRTATRRSYTHPREVMARKHSSYATRCRSICAFP
jgi:SAM-dependent methyltransferase